MTDRLSLTRLAGVLAIALTLAPTTGVLAQSAPQRPGVIPYPQGAFNPSLARRSLTLSPTLTSSQPVTMGPSSGPIGSAIRVQVNQNFGAAPVLLSFKAVVSNGVPARLHSRLSGSGSSYSTPAPIQMCIQGGGTWEAELVLANGRNLGVIGSFTPTNCPR
jgi:hypothetical protein